MDAFALLTDQGQPDWRYFDTYASALARADRFEEAAVWQARVIAGIPPGLPSLETKRAIASRKRFATHKKLDFSP